MERVDDDKWLDEALTGALGSDDTQPDFRKWMAHHPEAVEKLTTRTPEEQPPSATNTIRINAWLVKLAAAAVIAIAAIVGITQLTPPEATEPGAAVAPAQAQNLSGPLTHTFPDGSTVTLADGAQIRTYGAAGKRGFEHLTGTIDVTVAKGRGAFVVTTPYGDVTALGTEFALDLIDGTTVNTQEHIELLAVEVAEGSVEVSNDKGASVLRAQQKLVVEKDQAPYHMAEDGSVPARLRERMDAMLAAIEAGDAQAYAANYNVDHLYKLVKGAVAYDANLFGGTAEDARRLQQMFGDIASVEALRAVFVAGVNVKEPGDVYLRDIEVSADGRHATARLVMCKGQGRMVSSSPQWHFFDNDWWQVDD